MAQSLWCSQGASANGLHSKSCLNLSVSNTFSYLRPCLRHKCIQSTNCPHLTNHWTRNQLSQSDPACALIIPKFIAKANAARALITEAAESTTHDQTLAAREVAEAESLQILEWPAICKQVACFCGTSAASDLLARGNLPRGRSREESELLLQQTAEALDANLTVRGCFDIRPAVEAAVAGICLNGKQLEGVASTLEAAFEVREHARALKTDLAETSGTSSPAASSAAAAAGEGITSAGSESSNGHGSRGSARTSTATFRYPALAALAEGIGEEERTLLRAIRGCIRFGSVTDAASESLAAVRAARQSNKETLRGQVEMWARSLQAKGASEPGSVSLVRGRLCVGVRAGRQGDLPRGSVRLGSSSTGATLYMEPAPLVPLNNQEALLAEQEEQEVTRVLGLLSQMLAARSSAVMTLLSAVTDLDVVAARAGHSVWMGTSNRAEFGEPGPGVSPLHFPGLLHPVLMQRGLPPPPQPPSVDDNRFDRDFAAAPAWELKRVVRPEGPQPEGPVGGEGGDGDGGIGGGVVARLPRPLDLRVPSGRAVVAITGPNTGGKTVTLKAAGLAVLMAQAGLYLPCVPEAIATHGPPRLAWFDTVLADIGDAQSLQQSLSTFSGHIRRIKQVLSAAGPASLVLLDEVGSGTDPLEGAALARAVLDRLGGQARLTLATTHHAELKRAAEEDQRFVNVSMAFDVASLRPTYRLVWGAAGASNALDIAETLGFDRSVVTEARKIARVLADTAATSPTSSSSAAPSTASWAPGSASSRLAGVAASLVAQLEETEREVEEAAALKERQTAMQARLKEAIASVQQMEQLLRESPQQIVLERDTIASEVQEALDAFAAGLASQARVEEALRRIEVLIPDQVAAHRGQRRRTTGAGSGGAAGEDDDEEEWDDGRVLRPGDAVYIKSYGDMGHATVVSVKGDHVTVKFDASRLLLGGGATGRAGRSVKLHKRQVQRVQGGQSAPFGVVGWSAGYSELAADIRRVLGEAAGQQRDMEAAAAATAQRTSRRTDTRSSPSAATASYGTLYDTVAHEVDAVTEDLLTYDYGSPDVNYVAEALEDEDDGYETDSRASSR